MTGAYMTGATQFLLKYFLMFMSGAVFANLMAASGAARSIGLALAKLAKKFPGHETYAALWCAVVIGVVITYGGVMLFVAFFTIIAIVKEMYQELDVPWRMYTVVPFGTAALSMTMIPGSPSANNAVAAGWLGTNAMSGPMLGLIATVLSLIVGHFYLSHEAKKIKLKNEGFLPSGEHIMKVQFESPEPMNLFLALLPSIILLIVLNVLDMGRDHRLLRGHCDRRHRLRVRNALKASTNW
jgi:H+/gluconate symporter-like permease